MAVEFNPSNLRKKSITRDIHGNIINWLDEADGGWIIRGRRIVNQEKYDEYVKKEHDKQVAAQAAAQQVAAPAESLALRNGEKVETKVEVKTDLEKRVDGMESNIAEILKLLKK